MPDPTGGERCHGLAEFVTDVLAPTARLRQELIAAAREAVLVLRDNDTIGDETRRRVERMLDIEKLRFNA